MKRIIQILIVFLIFLIINCSNKTEVKYKEIKVDNRDSGVRFEFVKRVKIEGTAYNSVYAYEKGLLVRGFKNRKNIIAKRYDFDMNLIDEHEFRNGQGPGEFGGSAQFVYCNNKWYAFDNTIQRLSIFDNDFNFIRLYVAKSGYPTPLIVDNCKKIFTVYDSGNGIEFDRLIFLRLSIPDFKKEILFETEDIRVRNNKKKAVLPILPCSYFYKKPRIYFLRPDRYEISIYDEKEEKFIKGIRVRFEKVKTDKSMYDEWFIDYGIRRNKERYVFPDYIYPVSNIINLKKGFIVIRNNNGYFVNCKGLVDGDYYDYGLNFKGKVKIPCFYRINRICYYQFFRLCYSIYEDNFYLIKEDERKEEIWLERWRFKE